MSTDTQDTAEIGTKPIPEHEWLNNLVGDWNIESEMAMEANGPRVKTTGTSHVINLGGLWAYSENKETMPNGQPSVSYFSLGYDVTFKEYRACMIMSASSHIWNYTGTLSKENTFMTLDCEGPDMTQDVGTAMYRDTIELVDSNHRIHTSYLQDKDGTWVEFAKSTYTRV